jgi:hypothetical protein
MNNHIRQRLYNRAPQGDALANSKWSDDSFLDSLRRQGDPQADSAVAQMVADGQKDVVGTFFKTLRANDTPLPLDSPKPLKDFMSASAGLPPGLDPDRLQRGGEAFLRNGLPSVVVLLASSLPRGYAAPCLCEILSISRDLEGRPFDRLMGVVQLLINISGRRCVSSRWARGRHRAEVAPAARRRAEDHTAHATRLPGQVRHAGQPRGHARHHHGFLVSPGDGIGRLGLTMKPGEAD